MFTWQDLDFELELVTQAIAKKISFIDNQVRILDRDMTCSDVWQIVSRNMTNLTPAQLEQFESTFRYFDRDETNTLILSEFSAALASVGIIYSVCTTCHVDHDVLKTMQDEDLVYVYDQLVQDYGAVTFEAFINLLVCSQLCGLPRALTIS